ncbi:hypothetical protein AAU61_01775 [Desulfocarbo indianensis]|nr:hypothetical protein AAU61_01775 [Desulfocarbo indianensis]
MRKPRSSVALVLVVVGLGLLLAGCAATTTAIRYGDLDVQTKMTDTIFLEPVSPALRTVFVQIRNTTDKQLNIESQIRSAIMARGYAITNDPSQAHYVLQANVLQVGRTDKSALENSEMAGVGGVVMGAGVGALLGGDRAVEGAAIGGLAVGAIEAISGSAVKVVWYSMITDIQIAEKVPEAVSQQYQSTLKSGSSSTTTQTSANTVNTKKYQTRIISSARKTNLEFQEALPHLEQGLINAIGGVF